MPGKVKCVNFSQKAAMANGKTQGKLMGAGWGKNTASEGEINLMKLLAKGLGND